jgi:hypothetical protein
MSQRRSVDAETVITKYEWHDRRTIEKKHYCCYDQYCCHPDMIDLKVQVTKMAQLQDEMSLSRVKSPLAQQKRQN